MRCYCLVAQSTVWSSCDCINLSDQISWSREWERARSESKSWRDFKSIKQRKQRTKQLSYVLLLLWSNQVSVSISGLFWHRVSLICRSADLAVNCQENQNEAGSTAQHYMWLQKQHKELQRIPLTHSYHKMMFCFVLKKNHDYIHIWFHNSEQTNRLMSLKDNKLVDEGILLVRWQEFIILPCWSCGERISVAFGEDQMIHWKARYIKASQKSYYY